MPDRSTSSPHPILLPAVLQVEGEAPCFGTIDSLTEQGLAFDFQTAPLTQKSVGLIAKLDFDLMGLHHSCKGLIVHIQNKRALLSLRETSTNVHAALQSINQDSMPTLAARPVNPTDAASLPHPFHECHEGGGGCVLSEAARGSQK